MNNILYDKINNVDTYKELYKLLIRLDKYYLISDFYHETMSDISYTNDRIPIYFSEYKEKFLTRYVNDFTK